MSGKKQNGPRECDYNFLTSLRTSRRMEAVTPSSDALEGFQGALGAVAAAFFAAEEDDVEDVDSVVLEDDVASGVEDVARTRPRRESTPLSVVDTLWRYVSRSPSSSRDSRCDCIRSMTDAKWWLFKIIISSY